MKHVSILIPEADPNLSSIVGSYKVLMRANKYWTDQGKRPVFSIQLVGTSKHVDVHDGLFSIHPNATLKQVRQTDLIIIPAIKPNYKASITANKQFFPWIADHYKKGAEVASMCTGAFLLASTGLLKGKNCSTHWIAADSFKKLFPDVNVVTDKVITDERGIYTNGGAYSFLHLLLYLVEKYCDRETAIHCSKVFEIDIDRETQSPFTIFSGLKDHRDEEIKKAQLFIEKHVSEKISIEDLASQFFIGRRNFDRRFIKATSNTPVEYMQKVKVEAAKRKLETSRESVDEIMYSVSYSDNKAFRTVFKRVTGLSPLEYRNKYNKEAMKL
ncbi:MAG: helix-turn-helix domain-containing protein [Bacteroidetes bacterium]|nr:helix-turn-helix domain-containing protein [Bacteroidota bacterium]